MRISINSLEKKYGHVQALQPISLNLDSRFITILGQSGCGKTTLLKLLAGLEKPTKGEIRFDDELIFSHEQRKYVKPNQRNIAMVFQDFALWPHMIVYENIAFGLKSILPKKEMPKRIEDVLRMVKMTGFEKRRPGELSGGQQQRVALARALAIRPKLILFDEPLSALDAVLREQMQEEIMRIIHEQGCQAIFVTHDQAEAMAMSDKIIVMDRGQIAQVGTPEEIYRYPATPYVADFIGKVNWFGVGNSIVRPEAISRYSRPGSITRQARVMKSTFIGGRYLVQAEVEGKQWRFYENAPLENGRQLEVFIDENQIYKLEGIQ